ncbi:glycosyltransferase family 4 protein [Candidatus Falkowbacteria bacterium]|nr:glycosyltransferase family 4 protein [Candidatus Falkowbacteria bacterium]
MKICYFGKYNPEYSRNRILLSGLKENGVEVIECRTEKSGAAKYFDLIKKHWKIRNNYEVMIVGFPGNQAVVLAKFLTKKPIIFDAFLSFYDSMVFDRQVCRPNDLKAKYFWLLDWLPCQLADKILLDTNAHINYFIKTFKINRAKFYRVPVGTEELFFYPENLSKTTDSFLVHFHGYFLPLHGLEYIIRAAKILEKENIKFNIIGRGKKYEAVIKLAGELKLNNVNFINPVPYEKLRPYINQADLCLGIFGNTAKTKMVVPNKIYEYLACKKPIITTDTSAIGEFFKNGDELILCRSADSDDLAQKILALKNNPALREKIAINGFNLYQKKFRSQIIAADLINIIWLT